jgi:hypothetical protein
MKDWDITVSKAIHNDRRYDLPHIPESSPTAKQLASLLKETDKTASEGEASIGGRVFMVSDLMCTSTVTCIGQGRSA